MVAKTYSKESGEIKGMEQDCREQASYDETEELKEERKSCAEEAFSQKSREIKGAAQLYRERDAFEKEKGEKEAGTLESEVQGGKSKKKRRKEFVRKIKRDVLTLYMCFLELPWYKKLLPFFLLCYAFSPLDLIPDFIPVLGLLDDLILLPFGIWVCRKLIPVALWEECAERVRTGVTIKRVYKVIGAILIAIIWGAIVFLVLSACGVF